MGHRALVAYRRADGTFRLHYCHWGEGLGSHISPATPFGGSPDPAPSPSVDRVRDILGVDGFGGYDDRFDTRVDPRPLATDVPPESVRTTLDPSFESLVVVSPAYESTTYLVCSLDPMGSMGNGNEADDLVLAEPDGPPDALREWFVDAKSRLSARVARGALTRQAARATLRRALAARAQVYPTDDASFLRDP